MASFRTLLPAPGTRIDHRSEDGAPDDSHGGGSGGLVTQRRTLPKRIRSVPQACQMCRQMKAKCDGNRPRCGNCIDRDRPCGYEGEAGQSRQAAMRSRLAAYDALFASLRTAAPADADLLLHRMRLSDDPVAILREEGIPAATAAAATMSVSATSTSASAAAGGISPGSSSASENATSPRQAMQEMQEMQEMQDLQDAEQTPSRQSAVIVLTLPEAPVSIHAIQEFYKHAGTIFHTFSEAEAHQLHHATYGSLSQTSEASANSPAAAYMASIVAIGMQFAPSVYGPSEARAAYDFARQHFELAMETTPFVAIKLAATLATFNLLTRNTVALMWIGLGLKLCREHKLAHKTPLNPSMSIDEWNKIRRVWRLLVFLSCWLSFAMGSLSEQEVEFEKINPVVLEFDVMPSFEEVIEAEMAKLSVLAVKILRVHLAFKEITVLSFESVLNDLQSWHGRLPPGLHMTQARDPSLSPSTARSILHLHLLHQGAIILVYRRMISQFSCITAPQASRPMLAQSLDRIPLDLLRQGIHAARMSAQVIARISEKQTVPRRGSVVILQAYACSIVLLHVAAQKQLHGFHQDAWAADLNMCRACVELLGYNSATDENSRIFHGHLSPLYQELCELACGSTGKGLAHHGHSYAGDESVPLLLTAPSTAGPEHTRIAQELLFLLARPFRSLWSKGGDDGRATRVPSPRLPQLTGLGCWSLEPR